MLLFLLTSILIFHLTERGLAVLLVTDAERQQEEARLRRIQNPVTFHPASREPSVQANIDTDSRRPDNNDRDINRRASERPHSWRSQRETGQGRRGNHNALLFPNPGINHNLNQRGIVDRPANWNEGAQYERRRHNNNHGGNRVCFRCGMCLFHVLYFLHFLDFFYHGQTLWRRSRI